MGSDAVVPQHNGVGRPMYPRLQVDRARHMIIDELQDGLRLFLLQSNDAARELFIDVERILAGDGVTADHRMDVFHWLTPNYTTTSSRAREFSLFKARVDGLKSLQEGNEGGREALQG